MPPVLGGASTMAVLPASPQQAGAGIHHQHHPHHHPHSQTASMSGSGGPHNHHHGHHVPPAIVGQPSPLLYQPYALGSTLSHHPHHPAHHHPGLMQPQSFAAAAAIHHHVQQQQQQQQQQTAFYHAAAAAAAAATNSGAVAPGVAHRYVLGQPSAFTSASTGGANGENGVTNSNNSGTASAVNVTLERREAEVRELESREREAKLERDRMEKQRAAEQAVHKHFEESFRLAQQKVSYSLPQRNLQSVAAWSSFMPLAPPHTASSRMHHHTAAAVAAAAAAAGVNSNSQSSQQQQQQQSQQQQQQQQQQRDDHRDHQLAAAERSQQEAASEYAAQQQSLAYLRAAAAAVPQNAQQVSRPSSVPGKIDYPPPPAAHSRSSKSNSSSSSSSSSRHDKQSSQSSGVVPHQSLPKAEPNVSLFGYSGYQPSGGFIHDIKPSKSMSTSSSSSSSPSSSQQSKTNLDRDHHRSEVLPNPPPLLSDHKSSVIVKNEGNNSREQLQHQKQSPAAPAHSPSPKSSSYLNVQPIAVPGKPYDCRSPTQSPSHAPSHHGHHHSLSNEQSSKQVNRPGSGVSRHSPMQQSQQQQSQQSQQQQQQQLLSTDSRYLSRSVEATLLAYPPPHPIKAGGYMPVTPSNQQYPPVGSSKPKVSSPAPSHIYGKPSSGIISGTPVCRADTTSNPSSAIHYQAPHSITSKSSSVTPYSSHPPPPPAHSIRSPYDSRGSAAKLPPPPPPPSVHPSSSSIAKAFSPPIQRLPGCGAFASVSQPHLLLNQHPAALYPVTSSQQQQQIQTVPLDLGIERSGSPKRKATTPSQIEASNNVTADPQPVSLEVKKRKIEEPTADDAQSAQQLRPDVTESEPINYRISPTLFSRVSVSSPLIASAATSVTTVNSAVFSQSSSVTNTMPSESQTISEDNSVRPSSAGSGSSYTAIAASVASPVASPAPSLPVTPAKPDSPSPATRPPSRANKPQFLKKAWIQRHSGEDSNEDTTGVVGSGSCVRLPLELSNNVKEKDSSTTTPPPSTTPSGNSTATSTNTVSTSISTTTTTTTTLPSAVNSIHNVGSMAVNSIGKAKVAIKSRKTTATPPKEPVNGHAQAATPQGNSESLHEDSSNSETERKSPPKRKPPKVKRKKGAAGAGWSDQTVNMQEQRRRKKQKQVRSVGGVATTGASESSNDSEEAGSVSDSSEQRFPARPMMQISSVDNFKASGNGNKKVPKKRGRKPRSTKDSKTKEEEEEEEDYQPRQKKKRLDSNKFNSNSSSGGGGGNASNKNDKKRKSGRVNKNKEIHDKDALMKTGVSWIQDDVCNRYTCTRIAKCRECRMTPNQRDKMIPLRSVTVFCRFYAFRRMAYTKNGSLIMSGFNDPFSDANDADIQLWLPGKDNRLIKRDKYTEETQKETKKDWEKGDFDTELAYQIIRQVGDQFCDLIHQEKSVYLEYSKASNISDRPVVWKRVVKGVREMCDLCDTTLFNYHWTCSKCGFVVCIDCYEARMNNTQVWTESSKGRDKYSWLLCANRQTHVPDTLLLTQIIPADCLDKIDQMLHECRSEWGIPKHCNCEPGTVKSPNEHLRAIVKGDLVSVMNGNTQDIKDKKVKKESDCDNSTAGKANGNDKISALNWLADVALQNQENQGNRENHDGQDKNDFDSDSAESDEEGNHSTLRELLIRPNQKQGSRANSPENVSESNQNTKAGKKSKMDTLNEVISSVIEHSVKKEDDSGAGDEKQRELKHFVRRYQCPQRGREPLPIRIMTLTESKLLYPDVPHSWLCDGKLLRLHDPNNPKNYRIFQDQWKRGQPVIVSDVHKHLNKDLWNPRSFAEDYGEQKSDLVNCMTGNIVPKQQMWKFWDGFEHVSKRLKDDQGNAMLLKLKDWPSKGDFADILPTRFADLMKCIPLSEYTHRYGRLNLTSRLPDTFTRPDLGPKMYNAYGSALYPDKGTTNLHLDVSDAVNVMVYVGISKDGDRDEYIKEALKAVDEAGCDILTRRRVREKNEIPGALWHIYAARDADKIRDMLNAVALERGARLEPHHDPIHDQSFYLDGQLRERLYREYGVEGYAIVQCLGDAVFVPAGAPHQVRNLHNCIKVAEDFVSPENISHCFHLTQEFRALSDTHTNHEDKLQIKNIIYHAVKDSLTVLDTVKDETLNKIKSSSSTTIATATTAATTATASTTAVSGAASIADSKVKIKLEKSDGT